MKMQEKHLQAKSLLVISTVLSSLSQLSLIFIRFAWKYLFWEGKLHLADTSALLLSTKITFFPFYIPQSGLEIT